MAYVPEPATVEISRSMMRHLGAIGDVSNIFIARVMGTDNRDGVFHALHVMKTLLEDDFKFAVNQTIELEVFVVPSTAADIETLEAMLPRTFKFDDRYVKLKKVGRLELMVPEEDVLHLKNAKWFPSIYEDLNNREVADQEGYPRGYSDSTEPMEVHRNPHLSETTMSLLGIHEGDTEGLLKVNIKYMLSNGGFEHAYCAIPSVNSEFKDTVDQDGYLYLKFNAPSRAQFLTTTHLFVNRMMIKCYSVDSVSMVNRYCDKAKLYRVYWRVQTADDWVEI